MAIGPNVLVTLPQMTHYLLVILLNDGTENHATSYKYASDTQTALLRSLRIYWVSIYLKFQYDSVTFILVSSDPLMTLVVYKIAPVLVDCTVLFALIIF